MTAIRTQLAGKSFHVHFVPSAPWDGGAEYTVEARRGQTRVTLGRVMGGNGSWTALRIGAGAWTSWKTTRREAVETMLAGRTFEDEQREQWARERAA